MKPVKQAPFSGFAGFGGGLGTLESAATSSSTTYVDDVFSTYLYEGTASSAQTITNGIDISGSGGLVWIKNRTTTDENTLIDTARGNTKYLMTHSIAAEATNSAQITSFNSDGFSLGAANQVNRNGNDFCSWTFRKAPGFFDVVTWTGNGSNRTIAHNLGSVPGFIIVKRYSATEDWTCYHRSLGATKYIELNDVASQASNSAIFNDTEPTSSVFSVGTHDRVNTNGESYVAYVFAHDDQSFGTDEDEAIIKCGSYTGSGSDGNFVNLGFEPQFVLLKNASTGNTNWLMLDVMRGMPIKAETNVSAKPLNPNNTAAEHTNNPIDPNPRGFTPQGPGSYTNSSGHTFIYIAIRRPNKPPTAGTDVFQNINYNGQSSTVVYRSTNIRVDALFSQRTNGGVPYALDRLRGGTEYIETSAAGNYGSQSDAIIQFGNDSIKTGGGAVVSSTGNNYLLTMFKRAPGFFDQVTYTGTGSALDIQHNLEAVPELIIVKNSKASVNWGVYHKTSTTGGNNKYLEFNDTSSEGTSNSFWNATDPTATKFTVGSSSITNTSSKPYFGYLFATLAGISKVGTYTGTGSNINVDCGFTSGARWILIKRINGTGGWYVFNTVRGINSGNTPYMILSDNSYAAEVTNTDYIDPLNAGFTVTSSAPAALNTSSGTYLFLAVA